jgi:phage FluMu protein Com
MGARAVFMDERPRCTGLHRGAACNKVLAEFVTRPWSIQCRHCKTTNTRNVPPGALVEPDVAMQATA